LPPGYYNATFDIFTNNNSTSNSFGTILYYNYSKPLYYRNFNGNMLKNDSWNNLTVTFYLNNTYDLLNFQLKSYIWEGGKIAVKSLIIRQINNYSGIRLINVTNNTIPLPTMYFYSKNWQFYPGIENTYSEVYNSSVAQAVSSGPYISLPPGYYNATFDIFTNNNSKQLYRY
ncbi:MAG: hypothetical protein ACP5U0_09150, partial [Caldisphaera sp.]